MRALYAGSLMLWGASALAQAAPVPVLPTPAPTADALGAPADESLVGPQDPALELLGARVMPGTRARLEWRSARASLAIRWRCRWSWCTARGPGRCCV